MKTLLTVSALAAMTLAAPALAQDNKMMSSPMGGMGSSPMGAMGSNHMGAMGSNHMGAKAGAMTPKKPMAKTTGATKSDHMGTNTMGAGHMGSNKMGPSHM